MTSKTRILFASTALAVVAMRMPATYEGNDNPFPDVVDDINTIPERARGLYDKDGDKFKYVGVEGLKNSVASTRAERDAANKRAKDAAAYAALGKTPEEIKTLMDAEAERAQNKLQEEGNWNALREQMETNHTSAIEGHKKREGKLLSALERSLIDEGLTRTLSDEKIGGNPLYLLPHMRGRVSVEETDDGFDVIVKRPDGSPMLNADNKPASLADLAAEFKADDRFAGAFKGLNQSGGGGTGGSGGKGGGGGATDLKRSTMTVQQKVEYIREHGQAGYEQLPA